MFKQVNKCDTTSEEKIQTEEKLSKFVELKNALRKQNIKNAVFFILFFFQAVYFIYM